MNVLITICARGGSKGIPGKNIRPLNGKPLIGYTIEAAQKFSQRHEADIALSTDSEQILDAAKTFGLISDYRRPASLASDTAGKIETIKDIYEHSQRRWSKPYDFVLDLDVTSPLRTIEDLDSAFAQLRADPSALNIFSVSPAARNPYFNMVERRPDGYVKLVCNSAAFTSRQAAPAVFDMNASFYIYRKSFFDSGQTGSITERSLAFEMNHSCFDLDHPMDFQVMEILLRERLIDLDL